MNRIKNQMKSHRSREAARQSRVRAKWLSLALVVLLSQSVAGENNGPIRITTQPNGDATSGQDQPTVAKDSVQVNAFTYSSYRKNYDVWSWVPRMEFSVNGPIASGSQLYAEFTLPGGGTWVKFDCETEEVQKGRRLKTECGARDIPEEKSATHTGPITFSIKMRNELSGTDATLLTGRVKVGKVRSNEAGPKAANHFVYYVDHDWNLPIGYVFYERDAYYDPDDSRTWNLPTFSFAFWERGESNFEPHLFHGGKEVGKVFYEGREASKPSCGHREVFNSTTQSTAPEAPKFTWSRWKCSFTSVRPWDRRETKSEGLLGPLYLFSEHPGDYEIKIISKGRLVRAFKFAVNAEGKLVDNGIATANNLGLDRIIVPVQVLGDQDGPWDRMAWKTDAFYGNPLKGFTASP